MVWAHKDSTTLGTTNWLDDIAHNWALSERWVVDLGISAKRKEEVILGVCIVKNRGRRKNRTTRKQETENQECKHNQGPEKEEDNKKE